MHTKVCVSGGKKSYFFRTFCIRTKWMIPFLKKHVKSLFGTNFVCFALVSQIYNRQFLSTQYPLASHKKIEDS